MSWIVTFRGRVSMNRIASATSDGSITAAASLAACRRSAGQSASSAEFTGPGETWLTRMPCLLTCRRVVWVKQVIAHFEAE